MSRSPPPGSGGPVSSASSNGPIVGQGGTAEGHVAADADRRIERQAGALERSTRAGAPALEEAAAALEVEPGRGVDASASTPPVTATASGWAANVRAQRAQPGRSTTTSSSTNATSVRRALGDGPVAGDVQAGHRLAHRPSARPFAPRRPTGRRRRRCRRRGSDRGLAAGREDRGADRGQAAPEQVWPVPRAHCDGDRRRRARRGRHRARRGASSPARRRRRRTCDRRPGTPDPTGTPPSRAMTSAGPARADRDASAPRAQLDVDEPTAQRALACRRRPGRPPMARSGGTT